MELERTEECKEPVRESPWFWFLVGVVGSGALFLLIGLVERVGG